MNTISEEGPLSSVYVSLLLTPVLPGIPFSPVITETTKRSGKAHWNLEKAALVSETSRSFCKG